jgi:thiol-disulfide isomerase/thioredoxin
MPIILGKVYATWCGYCQQLAPEWSKLKKSLKNIKFVELEEKQINKKHQFEVKNSTSLNLINNKPQLEVNGYPTIFKIQPNQKIEYYNGERTANAIKSWVLPINNTKRKRSYRNKTYRRNPFFLGK